MRIRSASAALAVLPALVLATASHPGVSDDSTCRPYDATDEQSPILCEVDTYLQCPADDARKVHAQPADGQVSIDYDAPTRSVTEGAGCGQLDEPVFGSPGMTGYYELHADGFVDGGIDSATFDLWLLGPGVGQLGEEVELDVRFVIEGDSVFGSETVVDVAGEVSTQPKRHRVIAQVLPSDTQASALLRFTVTDIGAYLLGSTLDDEDRYVQLSVNYPHTGDCQTPPPNNSERCLPAGIYAFAWGSTEVPSGISYNRIDGLGTIVPAGDTTAG